MRVCASSERGTSQDIAQSYFMKDLVTDDAIQNRMPWIRANDSDPVLLLTREWLVTNGLGGYSSTSVAGACTRRYHGLLVSALPAPLGRMVMLSHFSEEIALPDESVVDFSSEELSEDHLKSRCPRWPRQQRRQSMPKTN